MLSFKKKLLIFICSLLPILFVGAWAVTDQILNNYVLELKLIGSEHVSVEYGTPYEEKGATAFGYGHFFDRKRADVSVEVEGTVDDQALGTYEIVYTAKYKNIESSVKRIVCVEDTTPPVITLVENPEGYTLPGHAYEEEGFTALDSCDGDLTDRVQRMEEGGKVTYKVSDQSGNEAVVARLIHYDDPIAPVLHLKGERTIAMTAGKAYKDPGYWAEDNCDGDITSKIVVSGYVDGYTPGTYKLHYSVEDSFGNMGAAIRTVVVSPHPVQEYVENPEKVIYLTFDDGPGPDTPKLLDTLKAYNVKATFFVVNTANIGTIKRAAEEGHTIAIHTATHRFHDIYASEEAYFADLYKMQGIIKDLTGTEAKIIRFPGGSSNTISAFNKGIMTRLTAQVKEQGFRYFDWNVDSKDAGGATTKEEVVANVIAGIGQKKTAIVLQHDIKSFSIEAVGEIITWGLENGYTFLPLTMDSPTCEHNVYN